MTKAVRGIRCLVIGHWSLVIGHWSLVIGHWSLVIGHWSLVIGHSFRQFEFGFHALCRRDRTGVGIEAEQVPAFAHEAMLADVPLAVFRHIQRKDGADDRLVLEAVAFRHAHLV